jgi:hypothetical protein
MIGALNWLTNHKIWTQNWNSKHVLLRNSVRIEHQEASGKKYYYNNSIME